MKILIIGLGSIGKKHVRSILSILPDAEIFALRSKREANSFLEVKNIFSYTEIASIAADFAIIANPTSEHKKTIIQLIEYEIPLFIEKPLYSSLDIKELIESIRRKKIFSYVACNLRFLDCIKFAKDKLSEMQNKKLNEVNVYCGSYLPDWRPNVDYTDTYSANAELGGGVHIDLIHELDYLYWLFGNPRAISRNFKSQSSLSIEAFDYANYLLDYEGFCANIVLNYYRKDPKRSLELVFEDETWSFNLLNNQVKSGENIIFESEQRITDTYLLQMEYFINSISLRNESFNTVFDANEVLKICLEK